MGEKSKILQFIVIHHAVMHLKSFSVIISYSANSEVSIRAVFIRLTEQKPTVLSQNRFNFRF